MSRLRSLQAPSRFASGGARVIATADDRNPLAQLLRAINETMLSRSLQFDSTGGPSLTLDVSGRRVLRLTTAIGLANADHCLAAEVLEDEHKDDLIKLLQAVARTGFELRLTVGPIARGGEQVSVGLPVALLADLMLVDLNDANPAAIQPTIDEPAVQVPAPTAPIAPPVAAPSSSSGGPAAFAEAFGPELVAWLVVGDQDGGKSSGPEEMISHLQAFLEEERGALDHQLDLLSERPGDPACIILGATLVEGHCILCARLDADMLIGVVEGDGTGAALRAWRGITG